MIKKKIQFKQIEGSTVASRLAVAALDGWYLVSPIVNTGYSSLVALVSREVKVTKDNLYELLLEDYKSEVGSVTSREYNPLSTFLGNEKTKQFMLNSARRYEIDRHAVQELLIKNLEDLIWIDETDEEDV